MAVVKILNIATPEIISVVILKMEVSGFTIQCRGHKIKKEWQIVYILIRLLFRSCLISVYTIFPGLSVPVH